MHKSGRISKKLVLVTLGVLLIPVALVAYVANETSMRRYENLAQIPVERVAIVFGAGLNADGTPSPLLAARVQAALDLYNAGRVKKLLLTGDNSRTDHDEVTAMKKYALERGVAEQDITLDYAGLSTYDSCYRARVIFGVTRAVVVTQNFHLPRALYICEQLGIDAVGLSAPDWGMSPADMIWAYWLREMLATTKAFWDVQIARPLPKFLGPFEGIG